MNNPPPSGIKEIKQFFRRLLRYEVLADEIDTLRLFSLGGTIVPLILIPYIFDGNIFPLWATPIFPSLFALTFILSFFSAYFKKILLHKVSVLYALITLFAIAFAYVNGFTVRYTFGLLIGLVLTSLMMLRPGHLVAYSILATGSLLFAISYAEVVFIDKRYVITFLVLYFSIVHFFLRQRLITQNLLQSTQNYLKKVVENSADGLILMRFDTLKILWVNEKFRQLIGNAAEKLKTNERFHINTILKHKISSDEIDIIKQTIRKNGRYVSLRECVGSNNRAFWAEISFIVIEDENSKKVLFQISDVDESVRKEEKLIKEKIAAETYLNLISGIIVVIDKNQKIVLLNRNACDLLKVREEDVVGKDYFDLFIPAEEREMMRRFHQIIFNDLSINDYYRGRVITISGEIKIIDWHNAFVYSPSGEITGSISYGNDVTEQLIAEEKAKINEERLKNVVDNLPNALFFETGVNRSYVSPNAHQFLKYKSIPAISSEELLNNFSYEKDKEIYNQSLYKWRSHGSSDLFRIDFRVLTENGEILWVEETRKKISHQNETSYEAGVWVDISERKKIEQDLINSESKFRTLSYAAPIGIYVLTPTQEVTFVNRMASVITGLSQENFNLINFRKIIHPSDMEMILKRSKELQSGVREFFEEFRILPIGSDVIKWVKVKSTKLIDNEIHKGWVVTVEDISESKEISLRIHESEQRFKLLSDASQEGVFLSFEETLVDVNHQLVIMLGAKSKTELIGKNIREFIPNEYLDLVIRNHENNYSRKYTIKLKNKTKGNFVAEIRENIVPYYGKAMRITVVNDVTERNKYETEIKESNQRLKSLIDYLPLGIVLLNHRNEITFANTGIGRLLVARPDEIQQKSLNSFIQPDSWPHVNATIKKAAVDELSNPVEIKIIRIPDLKPIEVEMTGRNIEIGKERFIQLSFQDISYRKMYIREQLRAQIAEETTEQLRFEVEERKKAELQVNEEKEYKKALIESSLDFIISTDLALNIQEFNQAATQAFGYLASDVAGIPIEMLFYSNNEYSVFQKSIQNQEPYKGEVTMRNSDGKPLFCFLTASPISSNKEVVGTICIIRDISIQKKKEMELRESEERFRVIYNQAFVGIARIAKTGRFMLVNQRLCDILGIESSLLHRMAFFQLLHKDDLEQVLNSWDTLADETNDRLSIEHRFINHNGETVFVNASVSVVRDLVGKVLYYIAVYEDITQRKIAEQQIRNSLREKEILIKEIHHRVKNNMQVISSILNLQSMYIDNPKIVEMLKESQNRIKSMSYIHEALYQSNNLEKISFHEYIKNITSNLNQSVNPDRSRINISYELDEVYLHLDTAIPLGLIINELITNSFKYAFPSEAGGNVFISIKHIENNSYLLKVSDDGIGLPANLDIKNTETLGLQLVTTLSDQINGKFNVESENGVTFTLKFNEPQ